MLSLWEKPATEDAKGNPAENPLLNSSGSKSVMPISTKNLLSGGRRVELHDKCKARKQRSHRRKGCCWEGRQRPGCMSWETQGKLLEVSEPQWQNQQQQVGGWREKILPPKVCAGVKRMVLSHFIHCLPNNNPSVDSSCFRDAAEDSDTDTVFLGQQPWIARVSAVRSSKEHFHPKPSLGIIHEVEHFN